MTNDSDDEGPEGAEDDKVGYKKPPKSSRFKKGQSGNPSGGWQTRRARQSAKPSRREIIERVLNEEVSLEGKPSKTKKQTKMTKYEVIVRRFVTKAANGDEKALAKVMAMEQAARVQPIEDEHRSKGGILVVYPTMPEDEWEKATEGELLSKNPLEGLPGGDEVYEKHKRTPARRRFDAKDDDDQS